MRGDTGDRHSGESDDQFSEEWQEIVSSLPELAEIDPDRVDLPQQAPDEDGDDENPEHPASPGPRDWVEAESETDDHFVPPEPAPLAVRSTLVAVAWIVVAAAPIGLILLTAFWRSVPSYIPYLLVGALVAALVVLFSRLPARRRGDEDDDSPDSGAVV